MEEFEDNEDDEYEGEESEIMQLLNDTSGTVLKVH